jgi:hypothetical protein
LVATGFVCPGEIRNSTAGLYEKRKQTVIGGLSAGQVSKKKLTGEMAVK